MFEWETQRLRKYLPISIIVPTYNRANYLSETLNAILAQQDQDLEVIVVDDFSTDDSRIVLESFKKQHPQIVLVFLKENLGESNAVNVGWSLATKQFICVVNSDDPPHGSWLKDMAQEIELNPGFGFYYPNRLVIDANGHVLRKEVVKEWCTNTLFERLVPIASAGLIIDRKGLPADFEPRDPLVLFPSDLIQMFRLGLLGEGRRIEGAWGVWREHSNSISGGSDGIKKMSDFKENIGSWILENENQINKFSRPRARKFFFFCHQFLILRRSLGFLQALIVFDKNSFLVAIIKDPLFLVISVYQTLNHSVIRLKRRSKIFSKNNILE
jgi:glycosyltransferase involved in cell wall biosynthesis